MKNVFVTILLAALPAWAVQFTNTNFDGITAGKPFDITWTDAAGAVTLTLKNGDSDNLQTVGEITCKSYTSYIVLHYSSLTMRSRPNWRELHLDSLYLFGFRHLRLGDQRWY